MFFWKRQTTVHAVFILQVLQILSCAKYLLLLIVETMRDVESHVIDGLLPSRTVMLRHG